MKKENRLLSISPEETITELLDNLRLGNIENVENGLSKLSKTFQLNSYYAIRHLLTQLMMNVIKWRIQPMKRVRKWLVNIVGLRIELNMIMEDNPEHVKEYLVFIWDKAYADALKLASAETGIRNITIPPVSWNEIFDVEYKLLNNNDNNNS